ncbi:type VI secretion system protein TssA [Telluria mixta]|uniref:Type VI secretion system protein TssA n=1 Tax=Telluria mixta TaxID=34071 RepID=A0ABT2C0Y5_9BURK|nr:type VI secretion system protein TssA [Telluria mixta]MCS0631043.1 type VI secretion system protein TssA [Telluria mixta]WEM95589.1 type VI secretion system protein TssA [Telluria mixta]
MFTAAALLAPISDAAPCGADLAFSPELDAIARARQFDDPSLAQGEWVTDLKEADWGFVVDRCARLLAEQTKDLRLAVWLTEAAARRHHLRGLGEGFRVLAGLCDRFWDQGLYPEADGGDQEQRIGNLAWILSRTRALVREMPLTEGRGTAYSTVDFEAARRRAAAGDTETPPRLADMEAAKRGNSTAYIEAMRANAEGCLDALAQLERAADERLGQDSPGFSQAREAVQALLHALPAPAAAPQAVVPAEAPADPAAGAQAVVATPQPQAVVAGSIRSRADAIAQLRTIAKFFRETEPHSPVSYFAEKAASAGEQDLHTWLRAVIKDQAALAHVEELLGVPPAQ